MGYRRKESSNEGNLMATKLAAAQTRMFHDAFVCRDCKRKIRTQAVRVIAKKVKCPGCGGYSFRPIRKK